MPENTMARQDEAIRRFIYGYIVEHGIAPAPDLIARQLSIPLSEVKQALLRLTAGHAVMVAQPGSCDVWRVAPFSALPTAFEVTAGEKRWWANCIWDGLGILSALDKDGEVVTSCPCCNTAMTMAVKHGALEPAEGVIHFLLPVRDWYQDIVFT
jgi:hypothetical protein